MRRLFALTVFAIIYGSLFPFNIQYIGWSAVSWNILFSTWGQTSSLGDILGNIMLFMPFGLLGILAFKQEHTGFKTHQIILTGAFFLAFILQILQIQIPSRSPELSDVWWNMAGTMIGMMLSTKAFRKFGPQGFDLAKVNIAHILAFLWIAYLLLPLVPTLDMREIKDSLKPIFLDPRIRPEEFLIIMTAWLTFATVSKGFFSRGWLDDFLLPIALVSTLVARVFIFSNHLDLADILGGLLALLLWVLGFHKLKNKARALVWLIMISLAFKGLSPFHYSLNSPNDLSWLPFSGMLSGDMLNNSRALVYKLFLYGSLLWFIRQAYAPLKFTTFGIVLFLFMIELIQSYSFAHSPEITDPFLALLIAMAMRQRKQKFNPYEQDDNKPEPVEAKEAIDQEHPPSLIPKIKSFPARFFISTLIITAVISLILTLPTIPYNVRELFLLEGNFFAILPFAAAILWFGISVPLMVHLLLKSASKHYLKLPGLIIATLVISYSLLRLSVTDESIRDITGSSNLLWFLVNDTLWGDFGVWLAEWISNPVIFGALENIIRFICLFAPVCFLLSIFYLSFTLVKRQQIKRPMDKVKLFTLTCSQYIFYSLPWLWLSKSVAFDWTSTDNLNELIERDGFFGLGGGGYLYLLLILVCLNATYMARSSNRVKPLLFTLTGLVIGWFLFSSGLENEIHKYGNIFSGVDFLLGPDRKELLSTGALFMRWIFVYVGTVAILVWGMSLVKSPEKPDNEK